MGYKAIPAIEKSLDKEKGSDKNNKIDLRNTFDALDILDHISQSKEKTKVIENYDKKLSFFFTECSEIITDIIK